MRKALRILLWLAGGLALLLALAFHLLYAPAPPESGLSARPEPATVRVGSLDRTYLLYAPARPAARPPLVVVFHGSMGSPARIRAETGYGFDRLADRHGFLVAYPQGFEGNWNDCRRSADYPARRLGIDDLALFDALVERLALERDVDPERVYAVGLSGGGAFVLRLVLERPERIAGAAIFAAGLPSPANNDCALLGRPPPTLLVAGTADPINPYEGGDVTLFGFANRGPVLPARAGAEALARAAGASGPPAVERLPARAAGDPTWAERAAWRRADGSEAAVLVTVHGGGHVVPQPAYRPPRLLGRSTSAIDGPAEAWAFFRRQGTVRGQSLSGAAAARSPPPGDSHFQTPKRDASNHGA